MQFAGQEEDRGRDSSLGLGPRMGSWSFSRDLSQCPVSRGVREGDELDGTGLPGE